MARRLVCPPTYFDIEYSINPWMDTSDRVDRTLAHRQWNHFVETLRALGDSIDVIEAMPGSPDMTFAGDAGIAYGRTFIPSNFRHQERSAESLYYEKWFAAAGYDVTRLPPDVYFEGLGDVVFHDTRALVGHGVRTDRRALEHLTALMPRLQILGDLRIVDDHYFHLAMALAFIDADTVLYYPGAFDQASVDRLRTSLKCPIAVTDVDANEYFACNNLVIGRVVLLDGCTPGLERALQGRGYRVLRCAMSEFKKSGGSLRCLVLTHIPADAEGR